MDLATDKWSFLAGVELEFELAKMLIVRVGASAVGRTIGGAWETAVDSTVFNILEVGNKRLGD